MAESLAPTIRLMSRPAIVLTAMISAILQASVRGAELDLLPSVTVSSANIQVRLKQIANFDLPSDLAPVPDGSGRLFVTELSGAIHVINGSRAASPILYHTMAGTQTLLDRDTAFTSIAFHPGFADSASLGYGKFYTLEPEKPGTATATFSPKFSSVGSNYHHQNVLYEYTVTDPSADSIGNSFTKRQIMRTDNPLHNHNLNDLVFDENGLLYIGSGDGGNHANNRPNAQDKDTVYGKVLRIDPLGLQGTPSANGQYSIPASNPFAAESGVKQEVYTYGNRNPYRINIDPITGDLLIAEVGQDNIEEVNVVAEVASVGSGGQNFGWSTKEGSFLFPLTASSLPAINPGLVDPILEYDHQDGADIIGGFVYRGSLLPELFGKYVFADHQGPRDPEELISNVARLFYGDLNTGEIFEFNISGGDLLPTRILGIGADANNELYVLGVGGVFYLVPEPSAETLLITAVTMLAFAIRSAHRNSRNGIGIGGASISMVSISPRIVAKRQ